jgi:hypothetical protein
MRKASLKFWYDPTLNPKILLLAPFLFGLHVLEEAPGYVAWFNRVARPPVPSEGFVAAQLTPLLEVTALTLLAFFLRKRWTTTLLLIWSTHFFFGNALFHAMASAATVTWSPGLATAVFLYLPFYWWLVMYLRKQGVEDWVLALIVVFAGLPMYLQTYMVAFKGGRYF